MLEIIITAIITSTIINVFFKRYHIPTIIGYILTWVIIAYLFHLQDATHNEELTSIAEFWIVFLMFTIWLEFSVSKLFKMKYGVIVLWWVQYFVTALLVYIFCRFAFWIWIESSVIIAAWISMSSTAIVLKLLKENRDIKKKYGQRALWILLFQDLAVIPVLLLIGLFANSHGTFGFLLIKTLLSWIWLIVILLAAGKYLFNPFFEKVYKTWSNEVFIGAIFSIVLGASYLAHHLWLSYSLWALIAWVIIAETHFKYQIEADLLPFRDLLLWVFFITVGMQLDILYIWNNLHIIAPLLLGIIFLKVWVIYLAIRKTSNKYISLKWALSLFQVWEFALVIFNLAYLNNLLDPSISQILITVTILSMIMTPFVLRNLECIADRIFKKWNKILCDECDHDSDWRVVLIWYGRLGRVLSDMMDKAWVQHIIIEKYSKMVHIAQKSWKTIILWDAANPRLLKSIHIKDAKSVIISVWNNERLFQVCNAIAEQVSHKRIIVKVNRFEEKEMLENLKLKHVIVETEATAKGMFDKI